MFEPKVIPSASLRRTKSTPIGRGGFKDVFEGNLNGKQVAIAEFRVSLDQDEVKKQHQRELRVFSLSSKHPNIVRLEGVTEQSWMVMEYCPGTLVTAQKSLNFVQKIRFAVEISRGLSFLHRLGLVHGDLKPANVLVSSDGCAKLTDFGFSGSVYTSMSSIRGGATRRYQAPESALSVKQRKNIDPRCADVYALGCVLLYLFFGKEPWDEEDDTFIGMQLLKCVTEKTDIVPAADLDQLAQEESKENAKYAESVCGILKTCFKTNPESRGSSRQVLGQLESVLESAVNNSTVPVWAVQQEQERQRRVEATLMEEVLKQLASNNVLIGNVQSLIEQMLLISTT
eukprot:TRINITY_DN4924_c0_g1_i3.p1 TRINITY_DN4924_c0_g1~~TRINITY_DN4924_c0_g1_i3.p1  ORF type:complete len:342 (-),score=86.33 TRINITY_DN4924_c0_g1_i3:63-1088(-)